MIWNSEQELDGILGGCMEKKKKIQRIESGVFKCISTNVKQEFMNQIV